MMRQFFYFISRLAVSGLFLMGAVGVQGQWIQSTRGADIAYFLIDAAPRVERYDLAAGQWLSPIALPTVYGSASAFGVDADTLYVAYGRSVKRYNLGGSNEVHIVNTPDNVNGILTDGNLVFLNRSTSLYARITSLNKTNNAVIAEMETYIDSLGGASIAPSKNTLFGRSLGVSPSDITYVKYKDDGSFSNGGESPYHGDYPGASQTWVFPDEGKVVDDSGTVYSTDGLVYLNSFGGKLTDLDFYGTNIPIVLRTNQLTAYSAALLPAGSYTLPVSPRKIYVAGTNVLAFTWDTSRSNCFRVDSVPLASLNPPQPGKAIDPHGLAYTPATSFLDKNGVLWLYSKTHQSLFRWDLEKQDYLDTIPLVGAPNYVAYSATNHTVYLAYSSGLINRIDLNQTNRQETPFAMLPAAPMGLATADSYVFASDSSGSWLTHYSFTADGNLVNSKDWNYYSTEYVWSPSRQKMYFFRDDTSPNDLLSEEINANGSTYSTLPAGGIGNYIDSPLHDSTGFIHPIRVAPDGTIVVLGSGMIHDATTLNRQALSLGNTINDAAWVNGQLRTIRTISGVAQLQQWNQPNFALGKVRQFNGSAFSLQTWGTNRLVAVCLQNQTPQFYLLDGDFNIVPPATLATPPNFAATIVSSSAISLTWGDVTGEEEFAIQRKTSATGTWREVGTAPTGTTNYADTAVAVGNVYYYRVLSRNYPVESAPTAEVMVPLTAPATPTGLVAEKLASNSIRVSWSDVSFESVYSLEARSGTNSPWAQIASLPADQTLYTNKGLAPNTQYYYRVRAGNNLGTSDYSPEVSATTDAVPAETPTLISAVATGPNTIQLLWSNVNYEEGYSIERNQGTNGAWTAIASPAANVTTYTDSALAPATLYAYRVIATNILGASAASNIKTATTTQVPPPSAPTNLVAMVLSSNSVWISWTDSTNKTGYQLERRTENTNSWELLATLPASATNYTNFALTQGMTYFYRVRAFNDYGNSPYSNEDDATPNTIVTLLADDFDPTWDASVWAGLSGALATNSGAGFRSGNALHFNGAATRSATTIPLEISAGSTVEFQMRAGNQAVDGEAWWDNSEAGESVVLEFSLDQGQNWNILQLINTASPAASSWTRYRVSVPWAAVSSNTQFRWRQLSHSGPFMDTWAIDDVIIQGPIPAAPAAVPFLITSPSSSTSIAVYWAEASGAVTYNVERKVGVQPWAAIASVPGTATYYTDAGLLPGTAYTYRIQAVNAGGAAPYSATAGSVTWSQLQQWAAENYDTPEALEAGRVTTPQADGSLPLLRFAFNLSAQEPARFLASGQQGGYPAIWFDSNRQRLCVEFVRRNAAMNPEIVYQVEFSDDLRQWTAGATLTHTEAIDSIWEKVRYEDAPATSHARYCRVTVSQH